MSASIMHSIEKAPSHRNDILKLIALLTMLIDHIGAVFFPGEMLWRTLGRIAFPIFVWQVVQGFHHTSSRARYLGRLFLFGCISQVPYMFLSPELALRPLRINIMFQLFSGVLLLWAVEKAGIAWKARRERLLPSLMISFFWGLVSAFLIVTPDLVEAWIPEFSFSYGTYGQLMFLVFYAAGSSPFRMAAGYLLLSGFHAVECATLWGQESTAVGLEGVRQWVHFWTSPMAVWGTFKWTLQSLPAMGYVYFQARSLLALPLLWLLQDHPSRLRLNKWVGYWFYPVHMAVLLGIRWMTL